ncbi:MAG: hypothetical protein Q4A34_03745 [Candidatus Saccharibacteria bacterium]|nr:hypothetical protein [Candidatus Saccharibacteria bacterium]
MAKKQSSTQPAPQQPSVTQPTPAATPQGYDPALQMQYVAYQQPVDPNRGKAKWLTFEYAGAMASAVVAALLSAAVLPTLFGMWVGTDKATASTDGFLAGLLSVNTTTPSTGLIAGAVLAVLLSVVALVLFARVSRTVPEREGYTSRTAYKVITYMAMAALVAPAVVLVAKLATVLIASLLFIGLPNAGKTYSSLYLVEFLPYLIGLAVMVAAAWMVRGVIMGRNMSRVLSFIVLGVASVVLIATSVTVAVKLHSDSTSRAGQAALDRLLEDY